VEFSGVVNHDRRIGSWLYILHRGGSGLNFSGSGWAWVGLGLKASGLGFFRLLKFKIGLKAFKSQALNGPENL
jgi:hypothetical protein